MTNQPTLFDQDTKAIEYHEANKHIYEAFKKFALEAIQKGHTHFSAEAVLNIIRWSTSVTAKDYDSFKVNNNYRSFYSRLFEKDYPQHSGFFFKRKSKYDNTIN